MKVRDLHIRLSEAEQVRIADWLAGMLFEACEQAKRDIGEDEDGAEPFYAGFIQGVFSFPYALDLVTVEQIDRMLEMCRKHALGIKDLEASAFAELQELQTSSAHTA